jgi:hypothetical protein
MGGSGGGTGSRVSGRDLEVLGFVARFGVVPRSAVARWAGTAKTATAAREKRLREAGLAEVRKPWPGAEPVLIATAAGIVGAASHYELFKARLSLPTLRHFAAAAHLAVDLEGAGEQLLSERELLAHERAMGRRDFSIRLPGGRHHRPDLIALGESPSIVEVELTPKGGRRLDEILAAWSGAVDAGRFAGVRYFCSAEALSYVKRSVERTDAEDRVAVEQLEGVAVFGAEQLI